MPAREISPSRRAVLEQVASRVPSASPSAWVLVAVDGVDGAGKSVFADELAGTLRERGRQVIRASVDGFQTPRAVRHRRGRRSPEGYWLDSFDYPRLRTDLLEPLRPGGSGRYRTASHDLATDEALDLPWRQPPAGAVLVLDGVFLHRDALRDRWDLSIYLDVPFPVSAARMAARDGSPADPDHPALARYVQAQQLYYEQCQPRLRASLVIDNTDLDNPHLLG